MYTLRITKDTIELIVGDRSKTYKNRASALNVIYKEIDRVKASDEYKNGYAKQPCPVTQYNVNNPLYFLLLCCEQLKYDTGCTLCSRELTEVTLCCPAETSGHHPLNDIKNIIYIKVKNSSNIVTEREIHTAAVQASF